jgi:hypothetical protein
MVVADEFKFGRLRWIDRDARSVQRRAFGGRTRQSAALGGLISFDRTMMKRRQPAHAASPVTYPQGSASLARGMQPVGWVEPFAKPIDVPKGI